MLQKKLNNLLFFILILNLIIIFQKFKYNYFFHTHPNYQKLIARSTALQFEGDGVMKVYKPWQRGNEGDMIK